MKKTLILFVSAAFLYSCGENKNESGENANTAFQDTVQTYLTGYNKIYQGLSIISNDSAENVSL